MTATASSPGFRRAVLACAAAFVLAACGGGGGGAAPAPTPPASGPPPITATDAGRLLEQATFGPTTAEAQRVQQLGASAWIDQQLGVARTGYDGFTFVAHTAPDTCKFDSTAPTGPASLCARDNYSLFQVQRRFFTNALTGQDQLRQRVAWALSQIMVVSGTEIYEAYGMAGYQNLLLKDAFGNFRQLLEDVTLSPVMGNYLDMVNNDKPNPARGTTPNENYARELLQLFSIGLVKLNQDGTPQLDAQGKPIPTYDQDVIEGFAYLFTGWTYPPRPGATSKWTNPINYEGSMVSFPDHHDTSAKTLLDGATAPAGQTPEQDLKTALDTVFNHPNVGPFISFRLIQHLVTSNPSPAYVGRVAAVFANDGNGVRGNLAAVVKAILTDTEARGDAPASANFGHLREPALWMTTLLRGLGGQSDGVYLRAQSSQMGQNVFTPPTVFNYYPPEYSVPGTSSLGPELFISDAATTLARSNFVNQLVYGNGVAADATVTGSTGTSIDLTSLAQSSSADALVGTLSTQLMHGSLSTTARGAITTAMGAVTGTDATAALARARMATYLVATSPQFQVER
jgi:uncharacterized protein (DUF1800 family)